MGNEIAKITVEKGNISGKVDKNVFDSFAEHLGRWCRSC